MKITINNVSYDSTGKLWKFSTTRTTGSQVHHYTQHITHNYTYLREGKVTVAWAPFMQSVNRTYENALRKRDICVAAQTLTLGYQQDHEKC